MRHDFEDGKYTVINDNGGLVALRHGEQWRDLNGDKLVCSMLLEVDALKAQRDELLVAAKLVIAWYEAEDDHSKADFYQRLEMCRASEAALRAAIAKAEGV